MGKDAPSFDRIARDMDSILPLWALLDARSRKQIAVVALFCALTGVLETFSIGLIIPFIAAATGNVPFGFARAWSSQFRLAIESLGVPPNSVAPALGLLFLVGTLVANGSLVFFQFYSLKIIYRIKAALSTQLLSGIAHRPLEWFENQNSADLNKAVMTDVDRVAASLSSVAQLLGIGLRCGVLSIFLLAAQLRLALTLATALGLSFAVVFKLLHKPLETAAQKSIRSLEVMYQSANELLSGAREIKSTGTESYFLNRFRTAAEDAVYPEIIRGMPPHVTRMGLESLIFLTIIAVVIYFQQRDGNLANGLPILSAYAVAGIRLLPSLQQGLFHWVQIRYLAPSAVRIKSLLDDGGEGEPEVGTGTVQFTENIVLRDVDFHYAGAETTLQKINLVIAKNETVAFVGPTGAGKSTLMDLLLGLRSPDSGEILVDGRALTPALQRSWRAQLGYVPQSVYLLDSSVSENVAFGIPEAQRLSARVEGACKAANIDRVIRQDLPQGFDTRIGERGARLSGGQCQRLGIARALYHDPPIIFFDEATSSLDTVTEEAILSALKSFKGTKTLIVVAHRLSTVWDFDHIVVLDRGRIVGEGRAEQLLETCEMFSQLVRQGRALESTET